jgi:hypothetical protein
MSTSMFRSAAAVVAVGIGTVSFLGSPASAQTPCYPPTPGCVITTTTAAPVAGLTLRLSQTRVTRGQTISAVVGGFKPGTSGIITIASVEQQIGSFTMPLSGTTTTTITIPTNISLGAHTVFARGTAVDGTAASVSQGVTVVAGGAQVSGDGSTLARTGAFVIPAAVVGLGLVGAGVALKRSGKRNKASTSV